LLFSLILAVLSTTWREKCGKLNLFYVLEDLATSQSSADRSFLLFEDKKYTYNQAYHLVLRYGNWLKKEMGIDKGDVVALNFQNTDVFVFMFLALWQIGATPAFINYNLSGKSLVHCMKIASTRLMLVDPVVARNVGDDVRAELGNVRIEIFTPELEAKTMAMDPVRFPDSLRSKATGRDMALLIYTSGTTGLPKAAVVSWMKLIIAGVFSASWIGTKSTDVYYTVAAPRYPLSLIDLNFPSRVR
jgi:acyl-CoA synthetase (AMP-forming)/AMP-acid ligase II